MRIGADGHSTRRDLAPDRLWVPALGASLLALLFVVALLVRADGDVSLLVHAAPPDTSAAGAPGSLTVQAPDEGFDGQFFYRLGVDPWNTDDEVAGTSAPSTTAVRTSSPSRCSRMPTDTRSSSRWKRIEYSPAVSLNGET